MSFSSEVVGAILSGRVTTRDALQRLKAELCEKYSLSCMPSNPEILAEVPIDLRSGVEPVLRLKPVRSLSGVAVVAVMTSPASCPHGRCMYCPGGPEAGTAQSYTGQEPAARRAAANSFDPYLQVRSRIEQLRRTGHPVTKIDLIVMGGTFPAREKQYQESFIQNCFNAMNGVDSSSIDDAHLINESARSRCIGLTIETRPDQFDQEQIDFLMKLGMTHVELGVQTVFEECMARLERGHTVEDSIEATMRAKRSGLKVCYHLMPGLPGSNMMLDLEMFRTIFNDPKFKPDMLKIYPTLVIKGTKLHDMWRSGGYDPPDTEYVVALMTEVKKLIPEWIRIQRVQRDIPLPLIEAGARKSNARQLIASRLAKQGISCRCIRCREVGHLHPEEPPREAELREIEYLASSGKEHFIELFDPSNDALIGFARLRFDERECDLFASLRELRVYGQQVPIDEHLPNGHQHRGYGRQLLERCEQLSAETGASVLRITSGVGARRYFQRFGFELCGYYMSKKPLPDRNPRSVNF